MSIIQSIRDKGAWIIFGIIALALIAFILQDSSLRTGNAMSGNKLGTVNGENIDRETYQAKYNYFDQMSRQSGQQMPHGMMSEQTWNYLVQQSLLTQEANKIGLSITPDEMGDVLFGENPPQWIQQQFTDPNTGVFNADQARQQFAQLKTKMDDPRVQTAYKEFLQPNLEQTQLQTIYQKYSALLTESVYVPKWLAEKTNADNSTIAKASYVYVPYTSVSDSAVKVTDDDISAYVKKHEKQFKRDEETRTITYISFSEAPTAADSAAVKSNIESLRQDFTATTDVKSFVTSKSNGQPYTGSYVTRNDFRAPYADTIMKLPVGGVYGPYIENGAFTLAKLVAKRTVPDSARVRHILIKTADQGGKQVLDDSAAKKRIDSIAYAVQHGASFDSMVQKYSDDPGSKGTGGEYTFPYSQFSGISKEFAETAFYSPVGTKKVVKVANSAYSGYHYIEVLGQGNMQEAYDVAYITKPIDASSETINAASTAASQFATNSRDKATFDANAKKLGKTPVPSQEIKRNDYSISAVDGENREFIKWIFNNKPGEVSDPVELGDQYIVAVVTGVEKEGLASAQAARPLAESILRNEKKAKVIIDTKIKGNTLESAAQSSNTTIQHADSLSFQSPAVMGVGLEPKVVGAAFNKQLQNKASSPIAGNSGVFVVRGEGISATSSVISTPEQTATTLKNMLLQQQSSGTLESLRKAATVKDNRSDIL
jgi:peptidyl-prolyl cis-trans isomerase D